MPPSWAIASAPSTVITQSGPPDKRLKVGIQAPQGLDQLTAHLLNGPATVTGAAELEVVVDKSTGESLGVDIEEDNDALVCLKVRQGLISSWNLVNPHQRVSEGDRIVEVNGVRGESLALINECRRSPALILRIQKGKPKPQPIDKQFYGQILDYLQMGKAQDAFNMLRMVDTAETMTVDQMASLIDNTSVWCQESSMIEIFDHVDRCKLVKFPDIASGTYFIRFSRWAVREYLAEALATMQTAQSQHATVLERSGSCSAKLTAQYKGEGTELLLTADQQLPQGHAFTRNELLYVTFPHTGSPGDRNSASFEAVLDGFRPYGLGPHKSVSVKMRACTGEMLMGLHGRICRVDRAANRVTFRRQVDALQQIAGSSGDLKWLAQILTVGESPERCGDAAGMCTETTNGVDIQGRSAQKLVASVIKDCNLSQQGAIKDAQKQRLTLIQGPPGTGKTTRILPTIASHGELSP
eukprot:TRINITY_DN27671_c1_g1_i3.p1 TRINITY_DN27671_c1_g1~~TRINITY_DN27671_c1_g1_i3.p1  ORF type:complete len:468 (-),score=61.18 TRINITY_DN27671_c1_g1_i3:711-2114(-)